MGLCVYLVNPTLCMCTHRTHHSKLYKSNFPDLVLSSMLHGSCVPSSSNSSRASLLSLVPPHPLLEGRRLDTGFTFVPVRFTCFLCFISLWWCTTKKMNPAMTKRPTPPLIKPYRASLLSSVLDFVSIIVALLDRGEGERLGVLISFVILRTLSSLRSHVTLVNCWRVLPTVLWHMISPPPEYPALQAIKVFSKLVPTTEPVFDLLEFLNCVAWQDLMSHLDWPWRLW